MSSETGEPILDAPPDANPAWTVSLNVRAEKLEDALSALWDIPLPVLAPIKIERAR